MTTKRVAVDALPDPLYRSLKFARIHHRFPHLRVPRTMSEKINWRILNDRRPLLAWTGDKLAMKEHASADGGTRVARTLWTGTDVRDLTGVQLPERWVLKPNHSTSQIYFGTGMVNDAGAEVIATRTAGWLDAVDVHRRREWIYSQARALLLVEEFIGSQQPPTDFKFFVFGGEPRLVQMDTDRFGAPGRGMYDPTWAHLPLQYGDYTAPPYPRPDQLEQMLQIASDLGREFDFVRVDLYATDHEVWFGEFTAYPASGLAAVNPRTFDALWGSWWQLPDLTALPAPAV